MSSYDKHALVALIREKALKFGDFTLASGKKASYYLDGKQVTLDPAGARLVAEGILDVLKDDARRGRLGKEGRRLIDEELNFREFKRLLGICYDGLYDGEGKN